MVSEIKWFYFKPYVTLPARGRCTQFFDCWFWKGDSNFILVLHCNYTSKVHRLRFNELFTFAGNDVKAISSLGGASGNFWSRIPTSYSCSIDTLFIYLERFIRYSTFFTWLQFPYWGEILGIWGQNHLKTSNERKTLAGRPLPYAKLRLLSHCAWNYLDPFGLCRCARKQKAGWKKSHKKCIFHVFVERPLAGGFQPNSANVFVSRALSNVQHFIVITWEVSELWGVDLSMLPGRP